MSLLNQLFNRGVFGAKCKTCVSLAISRMKLMQNKRELQLKNMRKEIAQFLQNGEEAIARIRVEHVIREMNIWAAYEILELFCEFVLARVPILDSQKECPAELKEAISSIIFAAPRCSDLPELLQIQNLFTVKYGKEFTSAITELRPDSSINRDIIEKLAVRAPSAEEKISLLKEISKQYNLEWDASNTKAEFSKKHEDLLDGSRQICSQVADSQTPTKDNHLRSSVRNESRSVVGTNRMQGTQNREPTPVPASKKPLVDFVNPENLVTGATSDTRRSTNSDILEIARAAIASAERASAAARAAAELVKVKSSV